MDNLTINQVDFKWVEETDDPKLLKKALKLLKDDGGFFPDLAKEIENKLIQVDKKFKNLKVAQTSKISPEEIKRQTNDILNWEKDIKKSDEILSGKSTQNDIFDDAFKKRENEIEEIQKKKQAENEKIKGNELMKTKEYEEAVKYYNNSINYDPNESTTYCNRALAYIKLKKYERGLVDCNKAIEIKNEYTKAYYRRAVCLIGLSRFREAFEDLLNILRETPNNEEILEELKNLKEKWNSHLGKEEFKKVEKEIDDDILMAIKGEKKKSENKPSPTNIINNDINIASSTTTQSNNTSSSGFKKMKIIEEIIEEQPKKIEEVEIKVTPHLQKIFDKFIQSGIELKKELSQLLVKEDYKKASELARGSLKDCQNFIKDFKVGSKYHLELEKAISDLNSFLAIIASKETSTLNKIENNLTEDENIKYYKTKILPEELRESATKLAEAEMNFQDFPKTSFGFEKAYNSMKKRPDVFFNYLKFLQAKNFVNFYKTSELSYQNLIGIIQCLKQYGCTTKEDALLSIEYLVNITKTKNFALIRKFLKKTDKENLKGLFENLKQNYSDLIVDIDLDKLYF